MSKFTEFVQDAQKALAAIGGFASIAVTQGLVHGTAEHWLTVGLSAASAALVYLVPNKQPVPEPGTVPALEISTQPDDVADNSVASPSAAIDAAVNAVTAPSGVPAAA